jgi:uncharacterized lipoprotein YajG
MSEQAPTKAVSILAATLLLAGCHRDWTTAEYCEVYHHRALAIEACLQTTQCVVTSDELRLLAYEKRKHPQCFKQEVER